MGRLAVEHGFAGNTDELGGAATQVRVTMGKEPMHFVRCFHGKMGVHSGGKASGFKNKADADSYDTDGISLFHVSSTKQSPELRLPATSSTLHAHWSHAPHAQ